MIAVVALLCAISVARPDCSRTNALDVLTFPPAPNEMMCQREAMVTLAALAIRADAEHYWLVRCQHTAIGKTVG